MFHSIFKINIHNKTFLTMSNLRFSINSKSETPARTEIETRGFKLIVDEPAELGGTNQAPNPVEYILGRLCRMY
jgi:uncharacterized OsmC-like protein